MKDEETNAIVPVVAAFSSDLENKEACGNHLYVRDEETNALVPVVASYSEDMQGKEAHGNHLYVRDTDTNALMPVINILGKKTGTGTESDPFLIYNSQDFFAFKQAITSGNTFTGVYHKIIANIDLAGTDIPLSSMETYAGHLDGNFKILSNITMKKTAAYSFGLFRVVTGSIKCLGLENVDIVNSSTTLNMHNGCLCGSLSGTVEKCFVTGTISPAPTRTGGITGYLTGSIKNCLTDVFVNGIANNAYYLGGIAGTAESGSLIENCIALGNISSSNNTYLGGLVGGKNGTNITRNSVAAMSVISTTAANSAFRIVGNNVTATNNYALKTMLVKGVAVTSTGANSAQGADATEAQLKTRAFYELLGWDFNIWQINEGIGYPTLQGFK